MSSKIKITLWGLSMLVIILLIIGSLVISHSPSSSISHSGCVAKQFNVGSSGQCVQDIQTMVNYMETAGLNECPFASAKILSVSGNYDQATAQQITSVQNWERCYSKQEGSQSNILATGIVNTQTWHLLCSYAYLFPSKSKSYTSPYRQESIAAGKNAGC